MDLRGGVKLLQYMREREGISNFATGHLHSLIFFSLCWGHTNQLGSGLTIMSRWFLCLHCMDVSGVCSDQRSAARRRVYFHHEEKKYSRYGTTKRVNQCPTSLIMKVATRTARSSQDRSHGLLCSAFLSDKNCPILLSKTQLKSCNLCDVGSAPL
jgi:hypothetical protein